MKEILGNRAYFMNVHKNPVLSFTKVMAEDQSTYICRVDFMDKKTQYTKVNLTVIGKNASCGVVFMPKLDFALCVYTQIIDFNASSASL